jgi:hypothetical protein
MKGKELFKASFIILVLLFITLSLVYHYHKPKAFVGVRFKFAGIVDEENKIETKEGYNFIGIIDSYTLCGNRVIAYVSKYSPKTWIFERKNEEENKLFNRDSRY